MNDNLFKLIMPSLNSQNQSDGGDMNIILPLVLLLAVDSGDTALIFCLLYILM